MKEKSALVSVMLIDGEMLEIEHRDLFSGVLYPDDVSFSEENENKLKQCVSYESQLYFDALKYIH